MENLNRIFVGFCLLVFASCSQPKAACQDSDFTFANEIQGTWSGPAQLEDQFWQVELHFAQQQDNECFEVRASFPEGGIFYFSPKNYSHGENDLSFEVPGTSWQISAEIDLEKGKIFGAWKHLSQNLTAPFSLTKTSEKAPKFKEEDIKFESPDGASLVGTLILPDGAGPFPAIVWSHGSGPDTRNTIIYASRAYLAASLGMASFIYDKRGSGESTGEAPWEIQNMFMDATSAIKVVRDHPNIKNNEVGIGGASQGGWVAPYIAGEDSNIAFVVVGSAPGITPAEQNIYSMVARLKPELGPEVAGKAERALRQVYEYYQTGEGFEKVQALVAREDSKIWAETEIFKRLLFSPDGNIAKNVEAGSYSTLFFDPLPFWQNISIPVFAVWGANDNNVPPLKSQKAIKEALLKNGNLQFTNFVFEGAGHGIDLADPNEERYYFLRLHPGYIPALKSFIEEQVNK